MLISTRMNPAIDEINLLRQQQQHHLVVRGIGEDQEIDLEIGPGDDDPSFANTPLVGVSQEPNSEDQEDHKQFPLASHHSNDDQSMSKLQQTKRKKKVVKKWREEWADTYKWAFVEHHSDGAARIFCSICKGYGRKHRRNPYGNEGSRNMQMSALEEHNNSLLHKEALRLQLASKDKTVPMVERPIYVKGEHLVPYFMLVKS